MTDENKAADEQGRTEGTFDEQALREKREKIIEKDRATSPVAPPPSAD